jgi:hypothetical protein
MPGMELTTLPFASEAPIQVSFVPTLDDQLLALRAVQANRRWWRVGVPAVLAIMLVIEMVMWGWETILSGGLVLLGLMLVGLLVPPLERWQVHRFRRRNPHLLGALTYTFTPAAMHLESPLGTVEMPLRSFIRVGETPDQILLFFAQRSAYYIPRRSLRDEDQRRLTSWVSAVVQGTSATGIKPTGR